MSMIRGLSDLQQSTTTQRPAMDAESNFSEIVALNNRGSLLLNAGNLKAASASFSSALQALKKTTPVASSRSCATEGDTAKPLDRLAPKIECFFSNRQQQGVHVRVDSCGQSPSLSSIMHTSHCRAWALPPSGGGDFIHDQPIELYQHPQVESGGGEHHHYEEEEEPSMSTHHVFRSVSFCVIYNLALSHHLLAIDLMPAEEDERRHGQERNRRVVASEEETRRRKLQMTLQQAAQLYAHAHVLLTRCCVREDYCILYDLAIFNNHGHVLYKLDRVAEGRRNFQILFQSIILRIKTPCGRYGSWSPLSHVETEDNQIQLLLDGILSNVLFYLMGSCKNAPAA